MKRTALLAFAASLAFAANAADNRENRPVSGFHALSMGAAVDVEVVQDGTESLSIEGPAETLAKIETVVHEGTLEFRYKRDSRMHDPERVRAVVHARAMDAIAISGSGNVKSAALKADALTLSISGSGDMDIGRVTARQASLSISGSGHIEAAGSVDELKTRISGSGSIKAPKLETQRTDVSIAGSGNATVWAKRSLATSISGVGKVRYYGDPAIAQSVRGVGSVERVAANP